MTNLKAIEKLAELAESLDKVGNLTLAAEVDEALALLIGEASEPSWLDKLASVASSLDADGLQKHASVLDEILLTIGASKSAVAQAKAAQDTEVEKLRAQYRHDQRTDDYTKAKEAIDKMNNAEGVRKAVHDQVKTYRPMEAPLDTRYCPDHPGVQISRIADRVYQCSLDKKVYNWEAGFTTEKGNIIPGGGVERQIPDWGQINPGHTVFDTRESKMNSFAAVKTAGLDDDLLYDMVRSEAESMGVNRDKVQVTDDLKVVANEYDDAVKRVLDKLAVDIPPAHGADAEELYNNNGPFSVYLTLSGSEGVRDKWDHYYPNKEAMDKVVQYLRTKLAQFADITGGGKLSEAVMDAALETGSEENFEE